MKKTDFNDSTRERKGASLLFAALLIIAATGSLVLPFSGADSERIQAQEGEESPDDILLEGIDALTRGMYRQARRIGRKLEKIETHSSQGIWLQARVKMVDGDPRKALKDLKDADAANSSDANLMAELGFACLATGDYEAAQGVGESLIAKFADDPRGHFILGESQWLRGNREQGETNLRKAFTVATNIDIPKERPVDYFKAERCAAGGRAAYRLNNLHGSLRRYEDALKFYSEHVPSLLAMGRMFTETEKSAEGLKEYADPVVGGPKIAGFNPNSSDGHLLKAYAARAERQGHVARAELEQAIRTNKYNVEARISRALSAIELKDMDQAADDIRMALDINPKNLRANAAAAVYALHSGDTEGFNEITKSVLSINPKAGEYYEVIGDSLARTKRLEEAETYFRKGIEIDPKRWTLHRGLGHALMYLGRNDHAKPYLETAHQEDLLRNSKYTKNLLLVFQRYEQFKEELILDGKVGILIHQDDIDVMLPLLKEHIERGMRDLSTKYDNFALKKPLIVEIYNELKDFETRTLGSPNKSITSACFGRLITMASPAAFQGGYNWAKNLRHQLNSAFVLQMSKCQAPNWLVVGSAVVEEKNTRPEWERHMEEALYQAYASNELPDIADLNAWIDSPRKEFAEYLSSIIVEYINQKLGGYGKIPQMLQAYAAYKTRSEVFKDVLGVDEAAFNRGYKDFVADIVRHIKLMNAVDVSQLDDLQIKAEDAEASTAELVRLARGHVQRGNFADARIWAGMAAKRGAESAEFSFVQGMLAKDDPRYSPAERRSRASKHFADAINNGLEDFHLYMEMVQMSAMNREFEALVFYSNMARRAFPTSPAPLQSLFPYYHQQGDEPRAQEIAEQIARLDETNLQIREHLISRYEALGDPYLIDLMATQIMNINPYHPTALRAKAEALTELTKFEDALFAWELLRRLAKQQETKEWRDEYEVAGRIGKANTLLKAGRREDAIKMAQSARDIDEDHARVKAFFALIEAAQQLERF